MRHLIHVLCIAFFSLAVFVLLAGCHGDEKNIVAPPAPRETINLTYQNPLKIEVNSAQHLALLLNDRQSPRGTALQLVDLDHKNVVASRILDFYDAYDVIFLFNQEGCFVGKTQDTREFAIQFFSLPDLVMGARVNTGDTTGVHGFLTADSAGQAVYYSHAGGGNGDGVYKIALGANKRLIDADDDSHAPFAFDNHLVSGLFATPARIFFDNLSQKIVVANGSDNYITMIDAALWGTVHRGGLSFPISGTEHWSTVGGSLSSARAEGMDGSEGTYIFAGMSGLSAFLSRFSVSSTLPYPPEVYPQCQWTFQNGMIHTHNGSSIFSVFIPQHDTSGYSIGEYGLNNLRPVAGSPHRVQTMPDSLMGAVGLDRVLNKLVVANIHQPRLELIPIR